MPLRVWIRHLGMKGMIVNILFCSLFVLAHKLINFTIQAHINCFETFLLRILFLLMRRLYLRARFDNLAWHTSLFKANWNIGRIVDIMRIISLFVSGMFKESWLAFVFSTLFYIVTSWLMTLIHSWSVHLLLWFVERKALHLNAHCLEITFFQCIWTDHINRSSSLVDQFSIKFVELNMRGIFFKIILCDFIVFMEILLKFTGVNCGNVLRLCVEIPDFWLIA